MTNKNQSTLPKIIERDQQNHLRKTLFRRLIRQRLMEMERDDFIGNFITRACYIMKRSYNLMDYQKTYDKLLVFSDLSKKSTSSNANAFQRTIGPDYDDDSDEEDNISIIL